MSFGFIDKALLTEDKDSLYLRSFEWIVSLFKLGISDIPNTDDNRKEFEFKDKITKKINDKKKNLKNISKAIT